MDIIDILDKKVKDTVEAKSRLEEKLVNLNKSLEKLSKDNDKLRAKNESYSKEIRLALNELEQIIKDLGI
jgi:FtsZ-binding cell division protein ZapB